MKTLKSLLFSLLLLAISSPPLFSQQRAGSIRGSVTDASTGEQIPFADVLLNDTAGNTVKNGITDIDGKYNINPVQPGTYNLTVSSIGMSTITIESVQIGPNIPTVLNVKMQQSTQELAEVVITFQRPLIDATKSSTTVNAERITEMAVRDISSVSRKNKVKVRGARSEGTVYYVDGINVRGNTSYKNEKRSKSSRKQIQLANTRNTSNESYDVIQELPFMDVHSDPLSTFASDVDAASYANVRRFITEGQFPPADAVRIEEMINYFSYSYPEPEEDETFSMFTEVGTCPWNADHQLLHIGIKSKDVSKENLPENNLVFLIDVSGSMASPDKLPLLQKSLNLLVKNLNEKDRVAIVVYASATGLVLESTKGSNKQKILDAINNLQAGGSTAGGAGIQLAYKVASENFKKGENNRVILATDGDFNVGMSSDDAMIKLIEEKRTEGVFLTVLGFGTGNIKDSKMEKLADHGNGNYAYIDNLMEAQKVLVEEMGSTLNTVAKDTKFQIEFNPSQVLAYRLIGYENRMLTSKDFNDDSKDAGDVGSGHSVTAIYEIIPMGSDEKMETPSIDPLKYQRNESVNDEALATELATLKIRYKHPEEKKSVLRTKVIKPFAGEDQLSQDFYFIAAIIETGMLLRGSNYLGESNFEEAISLAQKGKGEDLNGYRGEFIRLITLADKLEKPQAVGMR